MAQESQKIPKIDHVDRRILELLVEDGRMSYSQISERVGLSRTRVADRIAALESRGVIEKFTVQAASRFVRKPLPVFFEIDMEPPKVRGAGEALAAHADIAEVSQMSSRNTLHVHGFFEDMDSVSVFVDEVLAQIDGVRSFTTNLFVRRFKSQ